MRTQSSGKEIEELNADKGNVNDNSGTGSKSDFLDKVAQDVELQQGTDHEGQ